MAILHYTIGLPPTRKGGSVHYASNLIMEQARTEDVLALISGDPLFRGKKAKIKRVGRQGNVSIYELKNPLTPTLIYGTADPVSQHRDIEVDYDNIRKFIESNGITVFHIHTLMGLHSKIVAFIKGLGVKIVYTTHDFHGICLHYDFINLKGELCHKVVSAECAACNLNQPSDMFLRLANSSLYHKLKNSGLFSIMRQPKVSVKEPSSKPQAIPELSEERIAEYEDLIAYYRDYFKLIDKFHFNSTQTEHVFKQFVPYAKGRVFPVITDGIRDRRKTLKLRKELTFGFIGSLHEYKGFPMLKNVLNELMAEGYNDFRLMAYPGDVVGEDPDCSAISYQPPYRYSEISEVMYGLDCLIIPSKCYETFSLVALEALAHGCPVIVSDRVGAKDIVSRYGQEMIFDSPDALKRLLRSILDDPQLLVDYNKRICSGKWEYSLEDNARDILEFYNE